MGVADPQVNEPGCRFRPGPVQLAQVWISDGKTSRIVLKNSGQLSRQEPSDVFADSEVHVKTCRLWSHRGAAARSTGLRVLRNVLTKQLPAAGVRFPASERSTGSRTAAVGT